MEKQKTLVLQRQEQKEEEEIIEHLEKDNADDEAIKKAKKLEQGKERSIIPKPQFGLDDDDEDF